MAADTCKFKLAGISEGDKSLTTGNVIRLLREREFRFGKNWRGVARELGVSLEKRDQLSSLHLDADFSDFFEETIDDWLRNSDDPSWIKLIGVIDLFDKSVARDLRTYLGVTINSSESVDVDESPTLDAKEISGETNLAVDENPQLASLLKSMTLEDPQQIHVSCKVFNADTNQIIVSSKAPLTRDITVRKRPPRVQEFSSDTVKVGTSIRLEITTDSNCYMYIINIGTSGKTSLLLPNEYEPFHFFHANQTYYLPGEDFGFEINGPAGKETIQVLAFSNKQSILDKLVNSSEVQEKILYRDIVIKRKAVPPPAEEKGFALIQFDVQL